MKKVVLVGDSIRLGYREVVVRELSGLAEVWSPDENGGDSSNVLKNLENCVISQQPDVVHFNCGLHDIKTDFGEDDTAVSLDVYRCNLRAICSELNELDGCTVIWATTTPVNEAWHHKNKLFDRFEDDVAHFNKAAYKIVREFDFSVNDLFTLVKQTGRDSILAPDGVHYTAEGYEILGKQVAEVIRAYL